MTASTNNNNITSNYSSLNSGNIHEQSYLSNKKNRETQGKITGFLSKNNR